MHDRACYVCVQVHADAMIDMINGGRDEDEDEVEEDEDDDEEEDDEDTDSATDDVLTEGVIDRATDEVEGADAIDPATGKKKKHKGTQRSCWKGKKMNVWWTLGRP